MKIGCIGTGAMGGAIMRAVCKKYDVSQIKVTDKNVEMGKPFPSPGDLPNPGIEPGSLTLWADSLGSMNHQGSPA